MKLLDRAKVHTDRLAAWLVAGLGFLVLFLGYRGTSGTGLIAQQLSYIVSGGIVGLSLVGVGAVLLLSADLRDQWRELYEIHELLERQDESSSTVAGTTPSPQGESSAAAAVLKQGGPEPEQVTLVARVEDPFEEPSGTPTATTRTGRTSRSTPAVARRTARRVTETT